MAKKKRKLGTLVVMYQGIGQLIIIKEIYEDQVEDFVSKYNLNNIDYMFTESLEKVEMNYLSFV